MFVLDSLRWMTPATRRMIGIRGVADAETMRMLAFTQGFYNLLIALMVLLSIVLLVAGARVVGFTLLFAGSGVMLGAACVLVLSDRCMLRAALAQGVPPLVAMSAALLAH